MRHAAFLTEVIVDLGGEPTVKPVAFATPDGIKAMIDQDLELEYKDVQN